MGIKKELISIFDESSLVELGAYLETRDSSYVDPVKGDGLISGYASILGRLVYFASQDQAFLHGALGEIHASKMADTVERALSVGGPVLLFFDSAGLRVKEALHALDGYGKIIKSLSKASGMIPIISVIMGNAYGIASYIAQLSDFVIMCNEGHMGLTSQTLLKAIDNKVDDTYAQANFNEELAGSVDLVVNKEDLRSVLSDLISYLPDNNIEGAPYIDSNDDLNRLLNDSNYEEPRLLIEGLADKGKHFEFKANYGSEIITSLIRLNGSVIATIANNGLLTANALSKAARFVRFADSYNIPILTLTNTEGFVRDYDEEVKGLSKKASQLALSFASASVPKMNLIVKKAYGGAYLIMNSKHIGADLVYALEGSVISPMAEDASVILMFKEEIVSSDDPIKARKDLEDEYREKYANPYEAAKLGYVDDIINISEVRQKLISGMEMLLGKRYESLPKKQVNINL